MAFLADELAPALEAHASTLVSGWAAELLAPLATIVGGGRWGVQVAPRPLLLGYLLAKAHAARVRGWDKDYYDLVYVLLHNREGGPAEAARLLRSSELAAAVEASRSVLVELGARFARPFDRAAGAYCARRSAGRSGQRRASASARCGGGGAGLSRGARTPAAPVAREL